MAPVIRRAMACISTVGMLASVACSPDDEAVGTPASISVTGDPGSTDVVASTVTTGQLSLATDVEPFVPAGWEIQRLYRQSATLLNTDVDLLAVYLRPIGEDPSSEQYLEQAVSAVQSIASEVFAADPTVTAIDVCLQRGNDAEPDVEVEPAVQILGLREDLEPVLSSGVQLADLVGLSRKQRLVLVVDDDVGQAPAWTDVITSGDTTLP